MTKIIPISLMIVAILGIFFSLAGFLFTLLSYVSLQMSLFAVYFLVASCFLNAFPIVGGVIFNSKLCKCAMVICIICYVLTMISFILLLAR